MSIFSNPSLMEALRTIIDLPPNVQELDLRMRPGEAPTLTLKNLIVGPGGKPDIDRATMDLKRETRVFHLVEVQHFADATSIGDESQRLVEVPPSP